MHDTDEPTGVLAAGAGLLSDADKNQRRETVVQATDRVLGFEADYAFFLALHDLEKGLDEIRRLIDSAPKSELEAAFNLGEIRGIVGRLHYSATVNQALMPFHAWLEIKREVELQAFKQDSVSA